MFPFSLELKLTLMTKAEDATENARFPAPWRKLRIAMIWPDLSTYIKV